MTSQNQDLLEFLGFYAVTPFWAGDPLVNDGRIDSFLASDSLSRIKFAQSESGISVSICKDGMILIRVDQLEKKISDTHKQGDITKEPILWNQYLKLANVYYLLLSCSHYEVSGSSYLQLAEVTNRDAVRCAYRGAVFANGILASESYAAQFQKDRHPRIFGGKLDTFTRKRSSIEENVFQHCFERFIRIAQDEQLVERLSVLAKCVNEYIVGNYQVSIVNAWFLCERELSDRWNTFLNSKNIEYKDKSKRINSERRKLLNGRDFTAGVVSNILELVDIVSHDDLKILNEVRKTRNDIAHGLDKKEYDHKDCWSAILIASKLILEKESFHLKMNRRYRLANF